MRSTRRAVARPASWVRMLAGSLGPCLCVLAFATTLHAQSLDPPAREASFTAGASFGDGETALALSAGLAFGLTPRIGLGFELAYARKLDFTFDLCPAPRVCVLGGQFPVTGRTVSLVPYVAIDLSPASWRLRTYVQAGIGVGHLRQRYFIGPPPTAGDPGLEFTRSKATVVWSVRWRRGVADHLTSGGGCRRARPSTPGRGADARAFHHAFGADRYAAGRDARELAVLSGATGDRLPGDRVPERPPRFIAAATAVRPSPSAPPGAAPRARCNRWTDS